MEKTRYAAWFLGTVLLAVAAMAGFNAAAGAYILHHPAGASVQTLSGFERALKPVWLAELQPDETEPSRNAAMRTASDPFFLDGEKIVWQWPDAAARLVEELR